MSTMAALTGLPATLVEGFEATGQACTLPLLVSALIFVLAAGRAAPFAAVAHLGGAIVMAWARFARIWTADITGVNALIAGLVVATAAVAVAVRRTHRPTVAGGSAVGGAIAAAVWLPCVGTRLAGVINDAPVQRLGTIVPTAAYVTGTAALALAIAALPSALPRLSEVAGRWPVAGTGALLGVTLGLLMAIGVWDNVVDELLRRSTA